MENKTLLNKITRIVPLALCLLALIAGNAQNTDTVHNAKCGLWARFSYSSDGLNVKFSGTSNGAGYAWDFGDNSTGQGENPSHTYAKDGSYQICVTVYDKTNKACSVRVCIKVIVKRPCTLTADFEFSTDALGFKAHAKASEAAQYVWDFGDGTTGSGESAGHEYKQAGIYQVCVKVYSANTCSTLVCKKVEIKKPCTLSADFEFSTDGLGFKARAKASEAAKFVWDFGDGSTTGGDGVSHYYKDGGSYQVCVKVVSADGRCSTSVCKRIEVKKPKCELKIDASYRIDCATGKVQFMAHSDTRGLTYTWKFGNGETAKGENPVLAFRPGIYKVCLNATDAGNRCNGEYCFSFTVCKCPAEPCDLRPDFKFRVDCSQKVVYFSASSNGGERYAWDFGDGNSADGDFVRHQYTGDGVYEVCLKVWDKDENCVKSICKKVEVDCDTCNLAPKFEYRVDCLNKTIVLVGKSNGGAYYYWSFGDNSTGEGREIKHSYKEDGVYFVCLTVKDQAGNCKDQVCQRVEVKCNPCSLNPDFGFKTDCLAGITYFKATSNGADHYVWSFGDGTEARGPETKHQYGKDGTYEVCLKVFDKDEKCVNTICRKVVIDCDPCNLDPEFKYDVVCPGRLVKMYGNANNADKYYWSFGDGTSAEGREMKHQYAQDGTYEICLTVVDRKGQCKEQACQRIKVVCDSCNLQPEFKFRLDCSSNTLYLYGSSNNGALYYWSFGDGTTGNGKETKHTYGKDGIYEITLVVKDANERCKESFSRKIVIDCNDCKVKAGFRFEINYRYDSASKSRYAVVDLKNTSENADIYKWNFGDGGGSDQEHVSHIYRKDGAYKVCLTASDKEGKCINTYCIELKVGFSNIQDGNTGSTGGSNTGKDMKLYPNPSGGIFQVDCGTSGSIDVNVKDLSGKVIYKARIEDGSTIDLSSLVAGTYLVESTTESSTLYTNRLVIIK